MMVDMLVAQGCARRTQEGSFQDHSRDAESASSSDTSSADSHSDSDDSSQQSDATIRQPGCIWVLMASRLQTCLQTSQ